MSYNINIADRNSATSGMDVEELRNSVANMYNKTKGVKTNHPSNPKLFAEQVDAVVNSGKANSINVVIMDRNNPEHDRTVSSTQPQGDGTYDFTIYIHPDDIDGNAYNVDPSNPPNALPGKQVVPESFERTLAHEFTHAYDVVKKGTYNPTTNPTERDVREQHAVDASDATMHAVDPVNNPIQARGTYANGDVNLTFNPVIDPIVTLPFSPVGGESVALD